MPANLPAIVAIYGPDGETRIDQPQPFTVPPVYPPIVLVLDPTVVGTCEFKNGLNYITLSATTDGGGFYCADVAAMRALALGALMPGSLVRRGDTKRMYTWFPSATNADDGDAVVKPTAVGVGAGRLIKTTGWTRQFAIAPITYAAPETVVPGVFAPPVIFAEALVLYATRLVRRVAGTSGSTTMDVVTGGSTPTSVYAVIGDRPSVDAADGDYATDDAPPTAGPQNLLVIPANTPIDVLLTARETYLAGPPEGPEGAELTLFFV